MSWDNDIHSSPPVNKVRIQDFIMGGIPVSKAKVTDEGKWSVC